MPGLPDIRQAGLGQGHDKKRHPHAHSPGNFKELKCYTISKIFTPTMNYGIHVKR
jgi:hypothetical protein